MRWLLILALLSTPAMAQLDHDPENAEPVHTTPPRLPLHVIPASAVNADKAAVSPMAGGPNAAAKFNCSDINPCAMPTPAAR